MIPRYIKYIQYFLLYLQRKILFLLINLLLVSLSREEKKMVSVDSPNLLNKVFLILPVVSKPIRK